LFKGGENGEAGGRLYPVLHPDLSQLGNKLYFSAGSHTVNDKVGDSNVDTDPIKKALLYLTFVHLLYKKTPFIAVSFIVVQGFTTICAGKASSLIKVATSTTGTVAFKPHLLLKVPACAVLFATIPAYCASGHDAPGPDVHPTTGYTASFSKTRKNCDVVVVALPVTLPVTGTLHVILSSVAVPRIVLKLEAMYF